MYGKAIKTICAVMARLMRFILGLAAKDKGIPIFCIYTPQYLEVLRIQKQIESENIPGLGTMEAYNLYAAVEATEKVPGDIAEVGVYNGCSAKIILEATHKKQVYLFDTFQGLPQLSDADDVEQFSKYDYRSEYEYVLKYLSKYPNKEIYKGLFPATGEKIRDKEFSLVHLDVDLYESTLSSLEFFYNKMHRGGVLMSHDYPSAYGVKKAFDEFFNDKPEIVTALSPSYQCIVVKI